MSAAGVARARCASMIAQICRQHHCQDTKRWFQSIPVVDVGSLVREEKAVSDVAQQLHKACHEVGFFYVANHGVPAQTCQKVLQEAHAWFALPELTKRQILIRPDTHYRGYQQLGANVTRYEDGYQRDWHEAIDLYREQSPQVSPASPIHGPNQWPTQRPTFDTALREYIDNMLHLGQHLMRGIAMGLGLPQSFFEGQRSGRDQSYWCTRVIHYPPLAEGTSHRKREGGIREAAAAAVQGAEVERSVQLSCGEHTDYGLLTLVNQDPHVSALQVKNQQGQWISADPIPGTFVCNIGDMLKVWSNGLYKPTPHRVINADPSQSRVSIPFFYEPCYEAIVEPPVALLNKLGKRLQQHTSVRYGSHLEGKVLNNFEL
ncbi:TPA: hypothetical protein ACH3X2_004633 [Trebouxia sp. C0005]|nr:MAG: iron ascorbate oxidoreductase [Trebouxia sp. A1-2]